MNKLFYSAAFCLPHKKPIQNLDLVDESIITSCWIRLFFFFFKFGVLHKRIVLICVTLCCWIFKISAAFNWIMNYTTCIDLWKFAFWSQLSGTWLHQSLNFLWNCIANPTTKIGFLSLLTINREKQKMGGKSPKNETYIRKQWTTVLWKNT